MVNKIRIEYLKKRYEEEKAKRKEWIEEHGLQKVLKTLEEQAFENAYHGNTDELESLIQSLESKIPDEARWIKIPKGKSLYVWINYPDSGFTVEHGKFRVDGTVAEIRDGDNIMFVYYELLSLESKTPTEKETEKRPDGDDDEDEGDGAEIEPPESEIKPKGGVVLGYL